MSDWKKEGLLNLIIFFIGIGFLSKGISNESFWGDEAFTGVLVRHGFADIYEYCKVEMHSAFYYSLLKVFSLVFGSGEVSLRVFSLLGTVALAALGPTALKRLFNSFTGYLFSMVVFVTPGLLAYSHEARMYTWGAFFIVAMSLYLFLAYRDRRPKDLFLFSLFLIATMYTHVIGLVAGFFFNLIFLTGILIKRDYYFFKRYCFAAGTAALLFVPRIYYLILQTAQVNENFWIPPVNGQKVWITLQYLFGLKFAYALTPSIIFILILVSILSSLVYLFVKKDINRYLLSSLIGSYIITLLFIICYSLIIKPLLEPRYMLIPGVWVLVVFSAALYRYHKIIAVVVILTYVSLSSAVNINTYQNNYNGPMHTITEDLSERIKSDHVFVHYDELTLGCFTYYFPNYKHYFLVNEKSEVYWHLEIFKKYGGYGPNVKDLIGDAKHVWVVHREGGFNNGLFDRDFKDLGEIKFSKTYRDEKAWFRPNVIHYSHE